MLHLQLIEIVSTTFDYQTRFTFLFLSRLIYHRMKFEKNRTHTFVFTKKSTLFIKNNQLNWRQFENELEIHTLFLYFVSSYSNIYHCRRCSGMQKITYTCMKCIVHHWRRISEAGDCRLYFL